MAKNFYDSGWSWLLGLLTGIPFPAFRDAVKDEYGMNSVDREYIASIKRQVESGEISYEDAKKKLNADNWKGMGTFEDAYNSVDSGTGGSGVSLGSNTGLGSFLGKLPEMFNSIIAYYTRNELTGAEREQNAFNAEQAQVSRDFTEYMARNKYSMETQSMQDAGVNPAMVYGGGNLVSTASNGAQASGSPLSGGHIADLLSTLVRMPLEVERMKSEIRNINADTSKKQTETRVLDVKLPFEVDNLKAQVRNSNLDSDGKEIVNLYLDQQQEAEIRMKNATAESEEQSVKKMVAEIEKMDYEKTTMFISWCETYEKILTLQKQRELTDVQMSELKSLISVNNATAKKIGLDVTNYDDISVIGTASHSMHMGPFSVQEGEPITLGMVKAAREHAKNFKENSGKEKGKGRKSPDGQVSATDGSPYTGPIYD